MPLLLWIIAGLIVVGGGTTAAVADNSVPGQPLYGFDTKMEQFQERFLLWSGEMKTKFQERVSKERLQELEKLQNAKPEDVATIAQDLWEQHIEDAVSRIESRIDRLHEWQAELTVRLETATTDAEKAKIQKWLDRLSKLEDHRTEQLSKVEDREFPGTAAVIKRIENFREWQNLPKVEKEQVKEQVKQRIRIHMKSQGNSGDVENNSESN